MAGMDDVDFMESKSDKSSAVFLIDSGSRNRSFYPTPSEYLIEFSEPLRNVFGLDILDASIPSTMYNVDFHNNMLRYYLVRPVPDVNADNFAMVAMDFVPAFDIMACSTAFTIAMADYKTPYDAFLVAESEWEVHAARLSLKDGPAEDSANLLIVTYAILPASLQTPTEVIVQALGLEESLAAVSASATDMHGIMRGAVLYFKSRGVWYGTADAAVKAALQQRIQQVDSNENICVLIEQAQQLHDIIFTRSFYVDPKQVTVYPDATLDDIRDAKVTAIRAMPFFAEWHIPMRTLALELGNYNIGSLSSTLQDGLSTQGFRILSTSSSSMEKQNKYLFANSMDPFILDMKHSTLREVLGFDSIPDRTVVLPSNAMLFVGKYQARTSDFRLTAPGIVNLLGVRYLTLKCPEIEDHIHGSRAYGKHATGIGVFKLPAPNEVANLRFDFINIIRRPFHPIGRISRLTFRFEFDDNTKYDFKGINHQILVTLKFYSPPRVQRLAASILNPDYDPNYLAYSQRVRDYAERSDADDGDDDEDYEDRSRARNNMRSASQAQDKPRAHDDLRLRELIKEELKYDYSTTDEDDDSYDLHSNVDKRQCEQDALGQYCVDNNQALQIAHEVDRVDTRYRNDDEDEDDTFCVSNSDLAAAIMARRHNLYGRAS
jgi:hypothetical protein